MSASYAVIATGGRQVKVAPGETVRVDRLEAEAGQAVVFDKILLLDHEGAVQIGSPQVEGAVVRATVLGEKRDRKVLVFKRKRRKMYRRSKGHRQDYTLVKIDAIETGS